jgi:hypothetical protein
MLTLVVALFCSLGKLRSLAKIGNQFVTGVRPLFFLLTALLFHVGDGTEGSPVCHLIHRRPLQEILN